MAKLSSEEYYAAVRDGLFAVRGEATTVEVVRCMSLNHDMVMACHEETVFVNECIEKMKGALRILRNHHKAAGTVVAISVEDNEDEVRDMDELKALTTACDGDDKVRLGDEMGIAPGNEPRVPMNPFLVSWLAHRKDGYEQAHRVDELISNLIVQYPPDDVANRIFWDTFGRTVGASLGILSDTIAIVVNAEKH